MFCTAKGGLKAVKWFNGVASSGGQVGDHDLLSLEPAIAWLFAGLASALLALLRIFWCGRARQGLFQSAATMAFSAYCLYLISLVFTGEWIHGYGYSNCMSPAQAWFVALLGVSSSIVLLAACFVTRGRRQQWGPPVAILVLVALVGCLVGSFAIAAEARMRIDEVSLSVLHRELVVCTTSEKLVEPMNYGEFLGIVLVSDGKGGSVAQDMEAYVGGYERALRQPAGDRVARFDTPGGELWLANSAYLHLSKEDSARELQSLVARAKRLFPRRTRLHLFVRHENAFWEVRPLVVGEWRRILGTIPFEFQPIAGSPTLQLTPENAYVEPPVTAHAALGVNLRLHPDLGISQLVGTLDRLRANGWTWIALVD